MLEVAKENSFESLYIINLTKILSQMKKLFLSLVLLLGVVVGANSEANYVLRESFEGGQLPEGWTQENVAGQQNWVIESEDLAYPAGAADGQYRIALRNTTSQTIGFVTRLITPVMDLSEVYQPILVFSHAQQQRTGDVDQLRILYRSGADREWVELTVFDKKIAKWQLDTIPLNAVSKTYQIAFEATDKFGRGVVLDDIRVRAMPTCSTPENLQVDGLTTTSFRLRWNGSLDTDQFELLLNKEEIEDPNVVDEDALWKRVFIDPAEDGFVYATGDILSRNTTYYVYLRALCSGEVSDWADIVVRTQNIVELPYFVNFNNWSYLPGTVMPVRNLYWAQGTDIESNASPFINVNEEPGASATKSKSPDATHSLVFAGANSTSTVIPAGNYVYGATPELKVDNIQDVFVSFWGTANTYVGDDYAAGIIVGVMTDPQDIETFVSVDTCYSKNSQEFNKFGVSLASYQGNGKYVAFVSKFPDKKNLFYIDNVLIKKADGPIWPSDVEVTKKTPRSITLSLDSHGNDYNVVITKHVVDPVTGKVLSEPSTEASDILLTLSNQKAQKQEITLPEGLGGQFIEVYVQAVAGGVTGDWALPVKVLLPKHLTMAELPLVIDFEGDDYWSPSMLSEYTTINGTQHYPYTTEVIPSYYTEAGVVKKSWPSVQTTSSALPDYAKGKYVSWFLKEFQVETSEGFGYDWVLDHGAYFALPEVDNVKDVVLSFHLLNYNDYNLSAVAVGVMTDPYDYTTFDTLEIFSATADKSTYQKFVRTFTDYTGNGKYIAIMAVEHPSGNVRKGGSGSSSTGYAYTGYYSSIQGLDGIMLEAAGDCLPAGSAQIVPADYSANATWGSSNMTEWVVVVKDAEGTTLDSLAVNKNSYEIKNLQPHSTYSFYVAPTCDKESGQWTKFTTECRVAGEALPYIEGFEGYTDVGSTVKKIANCWTTEYVGYTYSSSPTNYSPYISNSSTGAHSGSGYLSFSQSNTTQQAWVGLPKMDVENVNSLQISFWIKGNGAAYDDKIDVGVLTDPTDTATFVNVQTINVKGNTWEEFIVSLKPYAGQGQYICIKKAAKDQHYFNIDDVKVKLLSNCGSKVSGITATRQDDGTEFKWSAQEVDGYEILIATEELADMDNIDASKVLLRKQVATFQTKILNTEAAFASNTQYYAYIRTYCSETNTGEWSNVVAFKTACMAETPESFGVEDFTSADRFDCWTTGINKLVGSPTMSTPRNTNGYLYLYNAKGTTTSLGQTYAIMPTLNIDKVNDIEITFQCHRGTGSGDGILDIGVCVDNFDSYMRVDTLNPEIVSASTAATGYGFNEALYYTVRFTDYVGDAEGNFGKKIVLLGRGNMNANNYIYIKNLSIRRLAALNEPIKVTIPDSTITVGQAIVNWDAQDGATGYDIKYATAAIDPEQDTVLVAGTKATIKTVTSATNTVTLTDLPGLTTYYVYVRSTNAEGKSIWSNMRKFKSSCPVAFNLPYSQDFDSYLSGAANFPDCWERFYPTAATSAPLYVYSSAKNGSTGNGLYMGSTIKNGASYAVLPKMEKAVKELMISFVYKSNGKTSPQSTSAGPNRYMKIGVATDVSSQAKLEETVVWLDEIICSNNTSFTDYTFAFNEYTGSGEYIVFMGYKGSDASSATNTTVGGLYIDDLLIEKIPTCFPATVEQKAATSSTVTVAITDNFNQTAWDLSFTVGNQEPEDGIIKSVQAANADEKGNFVIEGLPHSTQFNVYVRANCGGGDVSKWSKPVSMKTLYLLSLDQANWDFEYTDDERANYLITVPGTTSRSYLTDPQFTEGNTNSAATYSYFPQLYPTSVPSGATAAMYGYKSDYSIRLYSYSTTYPTSWFALPEIDADMDQLQLRFDATSAYISNRSTMALTNTYAKGTYPHSVKVGIMSDPTDWSTFTELSEFVFPEITATTADEEHSHWNHYTLNLFGAKLKGKYIAFATDYKATNYAYIDNIVVEAQTGCGAPSGLSVVEETLTATSAEVVWVSNKLKWNLQVIEKVDAETSQVVVDRVVTASEIQYQTKELVENLKPNTNYTLRVKTICGDEDESEVAEKDFSTPCAAYAVAESVWNFEDNLYQYGASASYLIPECWKVGGISINKSTQAVTVETTQSNMPYAIANTSSYLYAQGGTETTDRALRFYTSPSTTAAKVVWAQMPKLASTDNMQLHFWARAGYFSKSTKKASSANASYIKKLYIGTMTDVEDYSTFVKLDSVEYTHDLTTSMLYTEDEDEFWQEFLVPLDKFNGGKPVFALEATNDKATYYFIDNLEVLPDNYCFRPTGLTVKNVFSDRADITWRKSNRRVQIQLATDEEFADESLVVDKIMEAEVSELNLTNLPPETKLYLRARSVCGENEKSDWQNGGSFLTLAKPLFRETFTALRLFPEGWTRYSKRMINVVDTIANQLGAPASETVTTNWYRYPSAVGLAAGHLKDDIYSTSHNTWIVSKQIDLTMVNEGDFVGMSFDLAMTDGVEHKGAEPDRTTGYDDAFVVAISLDNAATWKSEDLTVWANQPFAVHVNPNNTNDTTYVEPKYVYNNISSKFGGERIFIDLSKYAGKIINFAFYGESTVSNADNDVHIDNVQINTYSKNEYAASTCRWEDYADNEFEVGVDQFIVGETTAYEKYVPGDVIGADRLVRMNLSVTEDQRSERDDEICEGTTYEKFNFNFVASQSGVYQQKLSCENGCDSVSVLNLTVLPKVYEDLFDEICHGKYMEYCGEKHYTTGIYECVYTGSNGCDSIVRHHLTVREILTGEETVYLCPNAEVTFGDTTITTPGIYSRVLDADGCDSLATLNVIEAFADTVILRAAIVSGDTYSKDPWRGLSRAGDYPISQDNIYGCDSTTILHLMVAQPNGTINDTITTSQLPYVLDGEELLPEGTEAGVYEKTITRDNVTFTLVIVVDYADAVANIFANSLALEPNLVGVGQPVQVVGTFSNAEVEVITATGAVAFRQQYNGQITLPGMPTAGIYLVRLTDATGVYNAKLVVK